MNEEETIRFKTLELRIDELHSSVLFLKGFARGISDRMDRLDAGMTIENDCALGVASDPAVKLPVTPDGVEYVAPGRNDILKGGYWCYVCGTPSELGGRCCETIMRKIGQNG